MTERNGSVVGAVQVDDCDQIMMITDAGTLVRTRVSEISVVGRNTQGVILIRTAEDENVVGLQRVAEPVDDEELDAIDGSVAEGDEDIAPEAEAMTTLRMTLTSNVIAVRGPDIRPFFFAVAGYVIYRYLSHTLFTS
ncbi:DNA gyrase subunit A [Salmonella enterica subsp. enterica]|uniref:DNA gyrase subunit A n=1 Tax=Salmonella enterica I TaxID=59201 RepID=A0A379W6Z9_SALET|nr:DNA gyrase subunit A [Salmonella enterica subsp. enterica]